MAEATQIVASACIRPTAHGRLDRLAYPFCQYAHRCRHDAIPEFADLVLLMPDDDEVSHGFSWRASQQELPDGRIRLSVSGTCNQPIAAHRVSLSRSPFQPSNPHILLLAFKAELVAGAAALQGSIATVTYEQISNQRYKLVSIQPGGIGVAVIDEHISGSLTRAPDQD